jgi:RHS repeat-associated protein
MTTPSERSQKNFGARYYSSNLGRFMDPDWSDDPMDPVPYADLASPQSLNLFSLVGNRPAREVDSDGHDCITTKDSDSSGVTVIIATGGASVTCGDGAGTYVAGNVDTSSFQYNGETGDLSYSYTPQSGGAGAGVISLSPQSDDDRLQAFADAVAKGSAGMEPIADTLMRTMFPYSSMATDILSASSSASREAGIPRLGTGKFGSNDRLNKMVRDASDQAGLNDAQRETLHDEIQALAAIAEHRLSYREIRDIAYDIARGIR